jgi:hypothetical protein
MDEWCRLQPAALCVVRAPRSHAARRPGRDVHPVWLLRMYRLIGDDRVRHELAHAVAACLDGDDARLVAGARQFFRHEPDAVPEH